MTNFLSSPPSPHKDKAHHDSLSKPTLHHLSINRPRSLYASGSRLPVLLLNGEVEGEEGGFEVLDGLDHLEAGFDAGLCTRGSEEATK